MSFEVIATDDFLRSVKKIFKKHRSIISDIENLGSLLSENSDHGTSLGNYLYKIRLAISDSGKGKSGGARVITYVKVTKNTVYMVAIYLKSEVSSVDEQSILQKLAEDGLL
jgi:mRNA-degrading endonuclease RelE of RelBE toxin-antitoxin system